MIFTDLFPHGTLLKKMPVEKLTSVVPFYPDAKLLLRRVYHFSKKMILIKKSALRPSIPLPCAWTSLHHSLGE